MRRALAGLAFSLVAAAALTVPVEAQVQAPLRFDIHEGNGDNAFFSSGPVAAHLMLTSGDHPRLIVAFPAGNSGAGVFFEGTAKEVVWRRTAPIKAAGRTLANGVALHGIRAQLSADTSRLVINRADVGSLRFIREAVDMTTVAVRPDVKPTVKGGAVSWVRERADQRSRYVLTLKVLNGTAQVGADGRVTLVANGGAPLKITLTALTGDTPLDAIRRDRLLKAGAADMPRLENVLGFLAYRQKLLAGSWRFLTYFGRDTLLTVKLLMPVLGREAVEAGLGSVIERVNAQGEVAHEEAIGELAVLHNLKTTGKPDVTPYYDYAMVDDNLMLLPVLAAYLDTLTPADARTFLQQETSSGQRYASIVARNAAFVLASAKPFAEVPVTANLIALKPGQVHGDWRDSEEGLGHGRYPYDVNTVLMPAALKAIADMRTRGFLGGPAGEAMTLASVWQREAVKPFGVTVPSDKAAADVKAYASAEGVPAQTALESIKDADVHFQALSLDADGKPIPVEQSDDGFGLLFGDPAPAVLNRALETIERPFPAGLMTPVGLFVANPVYADKATQKLFTPGNYHGTVVWSWQQAMWVAGIRRQLKRKDLDAPMKARLAHAECRLWRAIDATKDYRNSELWSWGYKDGHYKVEPFGQRAGDITESNAAQLWSTVFLGLRPPEMMSDTCAE
ncbi:hypothetical protein [Kordiimonas marina]|uniref:hypothetical protein n=1 Tax=Kordiimonas marina TaxID=2872312 RepID=UPI001FF461F6|nr:hypothetical protein [Kordiimonas marina]MCJ9430676.1 hypothetical protein [Kordiimonas marina]